MNNRIKELQQQLEEELTKQRSCNHHFCDPFYNPTIKKEGYGYHCVAHGSDVWGGFDGYRDVEVPRWTRTCIHCGYEEHTLTQKPVITKYEPDFS